MCDFIIMVKLPFRDSSLLVADMKLYQKL